MEAHLGPAIQKFSAENLKQICRFDRTGWYEGQFLLPGRETEGVVIHLPRKLVYRVTTEANLELAVKALEFLFFAAPPEQATVVLSFIFTGPVAALAGWRESDRCGLFLSGQTGKFKTSFSQCAMSIFMPKIYLFYMITTNPA
jgi:hypothetical protein